MKAKSRFTSKFTALLAALALTSAHGGSLWKDGITDERGMFADKRAKRVGDIAPQGACVQRTHGCQQREVAKSELELCFH